VLHELAQLDSMQLAKALSAVWQEPVTSPVQADEEAALWLYVPPGHAQLMKLLQALSKVLSWEEHLLSPHE
jgi:hypothetical protein